ncbi:MAG: hypothetical protein M1816_007054 [Peltula sp. TS41687]|nr:MAG: hypothetical protein M1816_007054 [Peltula sp. TS41687]
MDAWVKDHQSEDLAKKILYRSEVGKATRILQDRLAFASFKTKHGWENLDWDSVRRQPKVAYELKRKRSGSSDRTILDLSSSDGSEDELLLDRAQISPSCRKRPIKMANFPNSTAGIDRRKRARTTLMAAPRNQPSKREGTRQLSQSSPVYHRKHAQYPVSHGRNLSFLSDGATIPDEQSPPPLDDPTAISSDENIEGLPTHSFPARSSQVYPTLPRTPPPTRARSTRFSHLEYPQASTSRDLKTGEDAANALLYLATSPSPAYPPIRATGESPMRARHVPPATPPSRNPVLPSSMMTTPIGASFMANFGVPATPVQNFNLADFVHITPSPAQVPWVPRTPNTTARSPGRVKTSLAAKETRRRLNFEASVPPVGSSNLSSPRGTGNGRQVTGLGMELGGELVS